MNKGFDKRGQIAVYVIIALVVVGAIVVFYTFRGQLFGPSVPAEVKPVFDYYQSCIEYEVQGAISLAESQGGRVYVENYIPGSEYAPFSSQLNFLGFPVPYWFYVSGNGLIKENVPSKAEIQDEISRYVAEKVNDDCNFDDFYNEGAAINLSTPVVKTTISDTSVSVSVGADMVVSKGDVLARKSTHEATVPSQFGKLYTSAINIYQNQRDDALLENYSADVLRLYAPVDGVEISCSGKIWKTRDVVATLKEALEANIASIKFKGDYYSLSNKEKNYFVVDTPSDQAVSLIYSRAWPTKIEIFGADNELMVAEPVGTQPGMSMMGFCYAPYHFVYDMSFPVMIQIMEGAEIFQFPVVVIIDKNMPRQAVLTDLLPGEDTTEVDICQLNTQDVQVNVYDSELNKIDANISYSCMNQQCILGSTSGGTFAGKAPACVNGYVKARAEGYSDVKQVFSTNEEKSVDLIMEKEYDVGVELSVGGKSLEGIAIVVFEGADKSVSTALPDAESIKLSEGLYNVTVYAYGNSTLTIPASKKTQCQEVSSGGVIGGFLGVTKEECVDIVLPETKIDSALIGGGKSEIYILPSDLQKGKLKLEVDSLPMPKSLDELQNNFEAFDSMGVALAV